MHLWLEHVGTREDTDRGTRKASSSASAIEKLNSVFGARQSTSTPIAIRTRTRMRTCVRAYLLAPESTASELLAEAEAEVVTEASPAQPMYIIVSPTPPMRTMTPSPSAPNKLCCTNYCGGCCCVWMPPPCAPAPVPEYNEECCCTNEAFGPFASVGVFSSSCS